MASGDGQLHLWQKDLNPSRPHGVDGPYVTMTGFGGNTSKYQLLYKSVPRRAGPLPYFNQTTRSSAPWMGNESSNHMAGSLAAELIDRSYAQAYDRWHAAAGAKAQNAMNLLEASSSMAMIAARAKQLARLAKDVKRLRFGDAARTLGLRHKQGGKFVAKEPTSAWLELTFGWKPLINDIGTSVEILQRDFPATRIHSKGRATDSFTYEFDGAHEYSGTMQCRTHLSGGLKVVNPNLLLANQLGFVNPAAVAWDAVPFSFVVDWFIPVGKFLNSFTNEMGIEIEVPVRNTSTSVESTHRHIYQTPENASGTGFTFDRQLTNFVRPGLLSRAHLPEASIWLAATSMSLLVQQLLRLVK